MFGFITIILGIIFYRLKARSLGHHKGIYTIVSIIVYALPASVAYWVCGRLGVSPLLLGFLSWTVVPGICLIIFYPVIFGSRKGSSNSSHTNIDLTSETLHVEEVNEASNRYKWVYISIVGLVVVIGCVFLLPEKESKKIQPKAVKVDQSDEMSDNELDSLKDFLNDAMKDNPNYVPY